MKVFNLKSRARSFSLLLIGLLLVASGWAMLREAPRSDRAGAEPQIGHVPIHQDEPLSGVGSASRLLESEGRVVHEQAEGPRAPEVAEVVGNHLIVIRGNVRSMDKGAVISGANLSIFSRSRPARQSPVVTGKSNSEGAFELQCILSEGDLLLSATAEGFATETVTLKADVTDVVDLWLTRVHDKVLFVEVMDPSGVPVPHLGFRLWTNESLVHSWQNLTSVDGRFTLDLRTYLSEVEVQGEGPHAWLEAVSAEFGTQRIAELPWLHVGSGATIHATITLPKRWLGVVLGPNGEPLPDVVLAHYSDDRLGVFEPNPIVDSYGRFELLFDPQLPAGTLRLTHPLFPAKLIDLTAEPQGIELILVMESGIEVEGIVTAPEGQLPNQYYVQVIDNAEGFLGGIQARRVPVEASGYFYVRGIAANTFSIGAIEVLEDLGEVAVSARRTIHPSASGRTWVDLEVSMPATLGGTLSIPAIHGNGKTRLKVGLFPADSGVKPYNENRRWVDALGATDAYEGRPFELVYATEKATWPLRALLRIEINDDAAIERLVDLRSIHSSIGTQTVSLTGMLEFQEDSSGLSEGSLERRIRDEARCNAPIWVSIASL